MLHQLAGRSLEARARYKGVLMIRDSLAAREMQTGCDSPIILFPLHDIAVPGSEMSSQEAERGGAVVQADRDGSLCTGNEWSSVPRPWRRSTGWFATHCFPQVRERRSGYVRVQPRSVAMIQLHGPPRARLTFFVAASTLRTCAATSFLHRMMSAVPTSCPDLRRT